MSLDGARIRTLDLDRFFCGEQAAALAEGKAWLRFDGLEGECRLTLLQPCAQVTPATVRRLLGLESVELVRVSPAGGGSSNAAAAQGSGIAVRLRGARERAP